MNVIEQTLADALGHAKDIPAAAAEIRDIFKAGKEHLQAVRDEAKAFADDIVSKATASLDAFKAEVEKIEKQAEGFEDDDKANETTFNPIVYATATEHTATDGTITTLDHESGDVTAKDADGTTVEPKPEAVASVVQAAKDAGVALPETAKAEPEAPGAEAEPAAPAPVPSVAGM